MRQTLVIMIKDPKLGHVKTRLAQDIGPVAATWWFRHQIKSLVRSVQDPRWRTVLAVAPDYQGMISRRLPGRISRVAQGRGDLGARMKAHLQTGATCVIGADILGVTPHKINAGFKALRQTDVVFGPAPDGGFWLVGHTARRALSPAIFASARWSTEHALADSIASIPDCRVELIDVLHDVDTAADLP